MNELPPVYITDPELVSRLGHERIDAHLQALPALQAWVSEDAIGHWHCQEILSQAMRVMDCTTCGRCCHVTAPVIEREDMERLQLGFNQTQAWIRITYLQPMWADAEEDEQVWLLPSPCPMLADRQCSIYPYRPQICRDFPQDIGRNLAERLALWVESARYCPITYNIIERLIWFRGMVLDSVP